MTLSKHIKTTHYLFNIGCILVTTIIFTSCSDDNDSFINRELTEGEAAEIIETSLQKSTGGLNEITKTYSESLTTNITLNELCDIRYEDSYPFVFDGDLVAASHTVNWQYEMSCNDLNIPQTVAFNASSVGSFETQRIESNGLSEASMDISGLQLISRVLLFNGNFRRQGSLQITLNQNIRSVNSFLDLEIVDLMIDKGSNEIISGNGLLTLTGNTNEVNSFSFEGVIIFNGNETATLTINGTDYQISLD